MHAMTKASDEAIRAAEDVSAETSQESHLRIRNLNNVINKQVFFCVKEMAHIQVE